VVIDPDLGKIEVLQRVLKLPLQKLVKRKAETQDIQESDTSEEDE